MSEQRIEFYKGPAGGWGALRSVAHQLRQHRIALKGPRTLLSANQPGGFDCPGCAWPDSNSRTVDFCENGVKAVAAEITADRATPELVGSHTVAELATWSDHRLEALGRLTHPMAYDAAADRYRPIAWDEAFARIARHLQALDHPDQAVFYTSGRTSNEAAFLYQLFARAFGTNNFPDCSNMCHEPSGLGMKASLGVGKGTVALHDFGLADAIFIFGQNPGTNHPRMLGELREAARRGARIVSFNPLRERGLERFADPQSPLEMATGGATPISSAYHQVRIGGDLAVLKGLCKRLFELDDAAQACGAPRVLDVAFLAQHTEGLAAFEADLRAEPWEAIVEACGLTLAQLHAAAAVYAGAERAIVCWGMGITQHPQAVAAVRMICSLLLLRGQVGKPGAGACPVRGHSNVQGDRTMGIDERPTAAFLDRLRDVFGFEPPRRAGHDTLAAIEAMARGEAKVFIGMGGNFAAAAPDTHVTAAALRRCALTVQVSTKLNRSHLVHGREALILPCLGRTEVDLQATGPQGVTVEDSMSMVHLSTGVNTPASPHLLSEPMIVARMAAAALPSSRVPWIDLAGDYDRIRDLIARVFDDFAGFNARVRVPGGFRLPNAAAERRWETASGKAQFSVQALPPAAPPAAGRKVFTLATVRSHDQYNTTVYGLDDRYRGVFGQRRVVFIHPDDRRELGLPQAGWVDITSVFGDDDSRRIERFLLVDYDLPRGCLAGYYPETNPLVALAHHAQGARTPASKAVPVVLTPHAATPRAARRPQPAEAAPADA
ncbi:FdhF/YdeP family oxidoreductase [Aquincola sp. MAHUQ-54]|uniref:FdhF/YdeP family oxidoreductase n=1 Tax=Aquincola agrisoli TaxID=3119538 RepID=A0AAW9PYJ4_9BURK